MAATPDGKGYWLVAADGGIFSFGDAQFYGSTGAIALNEPIVAMAATPDGKGYWLVAADGGIFTFGDARFFGSWAADDLPDPVVGIVASPDGGGYTVSTANGVVLALGDGQTYGGLTLEPRCHPGVGHHRERRRHRVLAPRSRGLDLQLQERHDGSDVPRLVRHRRRSRLPDRAGSGHRLLLQPLRALRGVVRPLRHLGLAAGRDPHPVLCLRR